MSALICFLADTRQAGSRASLRYLHGARRLSWPTFRLRNRYTATYKTIIVLESKCPYWSCRILGIPSS